MLSLKAKNSRTHKVSKIYQVKFPWYHQHHFYKLLNILYVEKQKHKYRYVLRVTNSKSLMKVKSEKKIIMLWASGTTVINNETKTDYKKLKDSKVASEGRKKKIKTSLVINNIISIFHPWIINAAQISVANITKKENM